MVRVSDVGAFWGHASPRVYTPFPHVMGPIRGYMPPTLAPLVRCEPLPAACLPGRSVHPPYSRPQGVGTCDVAGDGAGDVTGDVSGDVAGDVAGDVT
eukprot:1188091-Prorocentrum_minimum.AAC.3